MPETTLNKPTVPIISSNSIRVLHVDDDTAFLNMAKQCLELHADIQVEPVQSVQEALELLKTEKYDVIVSDYQMKDKDGLEFLQELKNRQIMTPFILFTGKGRDEVAVKALKLGAFRYLNKSGAPDAAYTELALCVCQATDFSKTNNLLKESERRFRAIFDSSVDAILLLDDTGTIVYTNKAAKLMLDYAKDTITKALTKHFNKQFTAAYERNMHAGFTELSHGNLSMAGKTIELALKNSSGKTIIVELSFSAFIENGQWLGVSILRDVTERNRQKQLIGENQQTLKALFSLNPGAIVFTDRNYRVKDVNKSFTELFGFTIDQIKGKSISDFILPPGHEEESELIDEIISKGPLSLSTKRKKSDGSIITVALSGGPLIVNGTTTGFFMVYEDISNVMIVQNELEKALEKAKLLNEKISILGGFTRHDIRNKLTVIQGNIYLARNKCTINPDLEKYLHTIDETIKNITDIFDFAKTYEMIGVEELTWVNVSQMIQNAVSLFSDLKGVKINDQCAGLEVTADSLLTQIFHNLIDNSLKYGQKISTITIYAEKVDENTFKLCYKDDGIGIDEYSRAHLFMKGYGKGTGFGLHLIRKICEVYGWSVDEKGQAGQGVLFEFILPLNKVKVKKTT